MSSYQGYISNQQPLWEAGITDLQTQCKSSGENGKILYKLALSEYGLIGFLLSIDQKKGLDNQVEKAIGLAQKLLTYPGYKSKAHAVLGALYAINIVLSPLKTMILGPKSTFHINRALELGPNEPAAWVEKGNLRFHSPFLFGGSMPEAIKCFGKAIELYDKNPGEREHNWLYLHAYAWLGKSLEKEGRKEEAIAVYQKALEFEPGFLWVKDDLLPNVL